MNRRVWWVLCDYVRRTFGLWLLVLLAQFIQSVTFWSAGIPRVPLIAAIIASLAYRALDEKPSSVALRLVALPVLPKSYRLDGDGARGRSHYRPHLRGRIHYRHDHSSRYRPWAQIGLHGLLVWLVVSAIAVTTGLSMRRWVEAVFSLRLLPIPGRQLVFALYLAMILPGMLACVALSAAQHFSPNWGLAIPSYMPVVFLPAPVTLIRWERPAGDRSHSLPRFLRPATQQALWPAWAGVFSSMCGLPFMPAWFFVYLGALAALFSIAAYRALLAGIRAPTTLESHHSATLESI